MGYVAGAVGLALLAAGWIWYQIAETRRELGLEALARRLGLHFRFGLPGELRELLPRFRAIQNASERGGEFQAGINSITGTWQGHRIAFFDYRWTVELPLGSNPAWWLSRRGTSSRMVRTFERSALAIELGVGLQPLLIRPENLVDKALALVGYPDINFERFPEFSRAFYVNGPDRAQAERLVTPALAQFFLDHVRCTVDVVGPWMLLHTDELLSPGRVLPLLDLAGRLSDLVTREGAGSR